MEYSTADYLTGLGQKAFIAELMPRHPVYVNLLPPPARDAIGAVHADTAPARAMLEQEGFRYEGYVDIFDAGPTVECARDNIDAVRRSAVMTCTLGEEDPVPDSLTDDILWLVCNRRFATFRALRHGGAGARRPFSAAAVRRRSARRERRRQRARGAARAGDADAARTRCRARCPRSSRRRAISTACPDPTHNYSGLAHGNLAAERNALQVANPREAALQGLAKMRALAARGFAQAVLPPHERPNVDALRALGFDGTRPRRDRARGPRCAGTARRVLVGGGDVGGQRRDRERRRGLRRRPPAFHARESRHAFSSRARGADDDARAARDLRRQDALSRARSAAGGAAVRRRRRGEPHALRRGRATARASSSSCTDGAGSAAARRPRAIRRGRRAKRARRSRAATASIRRARVFAQQRPDAIDIGVFHNDVDRRRRGRVPVLPRARVRRSADGARRAARRVRRRVRDSRDPRGRTAAGRRRRHLSVQQPAAAAADGRFLLVAPAGMPRKPCHVA